MCHLVAGGELRVVATARPDQGPPKEVKSAPDATLKREELERRAQEARRVKEEKEKAADMAQSDWIKRYLAQQQEEGSDDADDYDEDAPGRGGGDNNDDDGDGSSSAGSDWEMWADPRERRRRKEQRSRQVAPEERAVAAAGEYAAAKEAAARAKERGDRAKQAEAGKIIRDLKAEIARLGLSEEVLYSTPPAALQSESPPLDTPEGGGSSGEAPDSWETQAAGGLGGGSPGGGPESRHKRGVAGSTGVDAGKMDENGVLEETEQEEPGRSEEREEEAEEEQEEEVEDGAKGRQAGQRARVAASRDGSPEGTSRGPHDASASTPDQHTGRGAASSSAGEAGGTAGTSGTEKPAAEKQQQQKQEEEEEGGAMASFFDEDAGPQQLPESVTALRKKEERTLMAWGMESSAASGKGRAAAAAAAAAAAGKQKNKGAPQAWPPLPLLGPKALLQQHCLKEAWPAPKFEKVAAGAGAASSASQAWGKQYAYSVTVVRPAKGRGKSRQAGGASTFQLAPDEDGFDTIAEAQNAVSALALYTLLPDQPLYRVLPQPYRDMWISWHDKGQATQKEAVAEEDARRSAFISSLVAGGAAPPVPPPSEQAEAAEAANAAQRGASSSSTAAAGARGSAAAATAPEDDGNAANASSQAAAAAAAEEMLAAREKLPMAKSREQLLAALRSHSAVVVSGETGSGKTTQVPQYVLDEMIAAGKGALCNIVCTQPRRIAAVSVAERVAAERCEPPPGSAGSLVGYHVRLDASRSASTRLLFCTTGILLRRLAGDRELAGVSHVVVDEVHERTLQKREALGLPPLKLILMSATLDATLFASYFGGCPVVAAEGRTHPSTRSLAGNSRGRQDLVRTGFGDEAQLAEAAANPYYDAELYAAYSASTRKSLLRVNEDVIDYELAEDLVAFIDEHHEAGAILVFLPGIGEIQALHDRLAASRRFGGAALQWLIPLHSTVAPADQKRAFQRPPPGVRKVVLATNIAETSITIDDVVFVVDTGKLKENRFDPR
eukprot:jgi/Mesen1/7777/ME000408S06884